MIHSTVGTAVTCYANPQQTRGHSGGNWFAPNGIRVNNNNAVPGFGRYAGYGTVRLSRDVSTGTPPQGIYRCEIDDNTFTTRTLYVGLYNSGGGKIMFVKKKKNSCISDFSGIAVLIQAISTFLVALSSLWALTSMEPVLNSPSPVSPLVDLLPLSLGPEALRLSLKELRLCYMTQ